jgi:hypothetical protein
MNGATTNGPHTWTARRWWFMAILVFLLHLCLVIVFGAKKPNPVRAVTRVPSLRLASADDEFIALNDPTLFALPHLNDFIAAIWMQTPRLAPPVFHWTEPPRWLPLAPEHLGLAFGQFMRTNPIATETTDFKPAPRFSEPEQPIPLVISDQSTLHLRGALARRPLLTPLALNHWPNADVIVPSKVQVLVDPLGRVISAILLPSDYEFESVTHDDNADQKALELARSARFAPAPQLTVGQMIFNWRAVPVPATNAPANPP